MGPGREQIQRMYVSSVKNTVKSRKQLLKRVFLDRSTHGVFKPAVHGNQKFDKINFDRADLCL